MTTARPARPVGNRYQSPRRRLLEMLRLARELLRWGYPALARGRLQAYRNAYALIPASTRRRWRCGR
jgi:hypothetical protein